MAGDDSDEIARMIEEAGGWCKVYYVKNIMFDCQ
jgi:hypothetical protein